MVTLENLKPQTYEIVLKNGKKLSVIYNKNQVIIIRNDSNILSISGYDKNNLRLKYNFGSFSKKGQSPYLFYGIPKKIEIQVAGKAFNHIKDFEDIRADINKDAYEAYKKNIENERKVVSVLKK